MEIVDTDNRDSFESVTTAFADNGAKLQTTRILDSGEEQINEISSLVRAINFAETFTGAQEAGQRVFDIFLDDKLIFDNLDIAGTFGFEMALDLLGKVNIDDGALCLRMVGVIENPSIAGLSI